MGVNLKQGYNGDLTSREAGSVGGQMVKKMIEAYENGLKEVCASAQILCANAGYRIDRYPVPHLYCF